MDFLAEDFKCIPDMDLEIEKVKTDVVENTKPIKKRVLTDDMLITGSVPKKLAKIRFTPTKIMFMQSKYNEVSYYIIYI